MRALLLPVFALLAAGFVAHGCKRVPPPAPPPPPPPPRIAVPAGCLEDLARAYAYQGRPDWRYRGVDDGGTLILSLAAPDGGRVALVFERTPEGFLGEARTRVAHDGGVCEVAFPAEIVSCADGGLSIAASRSLKVEAGSCEVVETGEREIHRLIEVHPVQPERRPGGP